MILAAERRETVAHAHPGERSPLPLPAKTILTRPLLTFMKKTALAIVLLSLFTTVLLTDFSEPV